MKEQTSKFNVEDVFKPTVEVENTDELVIAEYIGKVKLDTILEKYNISTTDLYRILNRKGIPLRNRMSKTKANDRLLTMSSVEKEDFAKDYMRGLKLVTLYKKYTLNRHVLYKLVDELGLPKNNRSITEEQQMKLELLPKSKVTTAFKVEDGTAHVYLVINSPQPIDSIQVHIEVPKEEK